MDFAVPADHKIKLKESKKKDKYLGLSRKLKKKTMEHESDSYTIFTNPSARTGYSTRSIFKRSLTGVNSEFSFSSTSCLTNAEEPVYPTIYP